MWDFLCKIRVPFSEKQEKGALIQNECGRGEMLVPLLLAGLCCELFNDFSSGQVITVCHKDLPDWNTEIDAQYACFKTSTPKLTSFFQTRSTFGFEDLGHAYWILFISTSILFRLCLKTAVLGQVIWKFLMTDHIRAVFLNPKEGSETSCSLINTAMKWQRCPYLFNVFGTLFHSIDYFFNIFCLPRVLRCLPLKFLHIPFQLADALGGVE